MAIKIGVNGYGRIGKLIVRLASEMPEKFEIAGINAPGKAVDYLVYMTNFDTVHGRPAKKAENKDGKLYIGGKEIPVYDFRDPAMIPWSECGAEYVIECTGKFREIDLASEHLKGGAKKVIVSAPSKDAPTFVMGTNEATYTTDMKVVSNASCTTNCLAPVARVLHEKFGIKNGLLTTVHSITASQKSVDSAAKKSWRDGRAASSNIIPTTTGAAKAVGKVLPELNGKLTGISLRVPTQDVSCVDFTANLERPTTYEEVCKAMKEASETYLKGILGYTDMPVVSSDFISSKEGSIFDATGGLMVGDNFVKVLAWYDNEMGYSMQALRLTEYIYNRDHAE